MTSFAGQEGQRKRWVEYFEELLNRTAAKNPVDFQQASYGMPLPIVCTVPMKEESRKAITRLKMTKQQDQMTSQQSTKSGYRNISGNTLPDLRDDCGENEVPMGLKKGYLIELPKRESSVCVQTTGE